MEESKLIDNITNIVVASKGPSHLVKHHVCPLYEQCHRSRTDCPSKSQTRFYFTSHCRCKLATLTLP